MFISSQSPRAETGEHDGHFEMSHTGSFRGCIHQNPLLEEVLHSNHKRRKEERDTSTKPATLVGTSSKDVLMNGQKTSERNNKST